jgi:putative restriction endonuclease
MALRGVLNEEGRISGRAQAAVRSISAADFNRIVSAGLNEGERELPRTEAKEDTPFGFGFEDQAQEPFMFEAERGRIAQLSSRIVRDRLFRRLVLQAYDKRCAITGLKLINGGGRAEVDAAHIRSVEANGPDILTNGIALSGTAHWMFDRGLISLSDDLDILISRQANDPESIRGLINNTGKAIAPSRTFERPHPHFLRWHRDNCFKQ